MLLAVFLPLTLTGCAIRTGNLPETAPSVESLESVAVRYRTDSDRLNLRALRLSNGAELASFSVNSPLTGVTISTLELRYPHPTGRTDVAEARLLIQHLVDDSGIASQLSRLAGQSRDPAEAASQPIEVWTADIPKWQLDGVVAKLEKARFFERAKVLGAKSHLTVRRNGTAFGKEYRAVDELDALILFVHQQGHPSGPAARTTQAPLNAPPSSGRMRAALHRLPPI
jgi:hypothetical protein